MTDRDKLIALAEDQEAARRQMCLDASAEFGDPPCWKSLPEAYASEDCSARCYARALAGGE